LIQWQCNNIAAAKNLFEQCGQQPGYAPFYAARAKLYLKEDGTKALNDLKYAAKLDSKEWRYGRALINYYLAKKTKKRSTGNCNRLL
jgi:hypothetical protein